MTNQTKTDTCNPYQTHCKVNIEGTLNSQYTHTTSKYIVSERLSAENETGELFSAQMKGKRKPLLIVRLLHCQV